MESWRQERRMRDFVGGGGPQSDGCSETFEVSDETISSTNRFKRIGKDHSETFTLFASLALELRITIWELAVAAATPALPGSIYPFPLEPEHPEDCLESAKRLYRQSNTTPNLLMILSILHVSQEFRNVALKTYGLLDVPIISPMLFRSSVDFLSFHDMHHMKEYTDMGTSYKFYRNPGVKVKRVNIAAHFAWPDSPFRSSNVYRKEPVEDPAREIWKLILLFEDLEHIISHFLDIWFYENSPNKHGLLRSRDDMELQRFLKDYAHWEKNLTDYFRRLFG
ncbi:hypothetical protein BCON_0355g00080 [Botryotinia convoluta]|uniref:2EXR domain-containing protein n=1 Tax=Botryotinia convoluta TaxID=54673 RepID=A0A4Z1HAT9_9HELO|nr:hypothetical protein BCON_0355g00080 [Botryotinia convoluta]